MEHLPIDSAYRLAVDTEHRGDWGINEQLMAQVVHLLDLSIYQQADPKKRGEPPKPIPMPWDDTPPTRSELTPAEMQARLLALRLEAQELRKAHVAEPDPPDPDGGAATT